MSQYSNNKMVDDPNHVWNKLANYIPDGSEVLDVGCSSANFGAALIDRKGCVVDGVEPDKTDAKVASKKLRDVWIFNIEDPKNVASIKKKYDVIVFADVLEHLVSPADTLKSLKSIMKPGGKIVFSVPNMAHVSVRLALLEGNFTYTETGLLDKTHLHFYDLDTVKTLFSAAKMHLSDIDGVIYGYPDELIHKRLNGMGYTATEPGMALLRDPRAAIFQFVGSAEYSNKNLKSADISANMPVLSQDIQNLVNDLQQAQQEVRVLESENQDLKSKLKEITNSKAYKVGSRVIKPARAAKSTINKMAPRK